MTPVPPAAPPASSVREVEAADKKLLPRDRTLVAGEVDLGVCVGGGWSEGEGRGDVDAEGFGVI